MTATTSQARLVRLSNVESRVLTRLICAREPDAALSLDAVQSILTHARAANLCDNLTGMLAFDADCFLQVIEGEREVVSRLYGRIAQDPRHRRLVLLQVAAIDERQFRRWAMGFTPPNAARSELYVRLGNEPRRPLRDDGASRLGPVVSTGCPGLTVTHRAGARVLQGLAAHAAPLHGLMSAPA